MIKKLRQHFRIQPRLTLIVGGKEAPKLTPSVMASIETILENGVKLLNQLKGMEYASDQIQGVGCRK